MDDAIQLRRLVEALHGSRRVTLVVPDPVVVAVRIEDDRALPELAFEAIRVEPGLLLTLPRVALGALGLDQPERFLVTVSKLGGQALQLFLRLLRHRAGLRQSAGVEGEVGGRPGLARVGVREPVANVEQLTHRYHSVLRLDRLRAVHRLVAKLHDEPRLGEHRRAGRGLERRLVEERAQVVLIRQAQRRVVLVSPRHRQLERSAGVEAGRTRIGMHRRRRPGGGVEDVRPFCLQEIERIHERWPAGEGRAAQAFCL